MPKLTNVRERVHQPFRDTLIRTSGWATPDVLSCDRTKLFTKAGKTDGESNLANGSTLPSDQSHVTLAIRCFLWFKNPIERGGEITLADGATTVLASNGDFEYPDSAGSPAFGRALNGQAIANITDVHRMYWQAAEAILWSFGAGDKFSLSSMPSVYFPYGGGLHGQVGGGSDILLWNNGMPTQEAILRIARAVLIPPRQNIKAEAQFVAYPDGGNDQTFGLRQNGRNMQSVSDNLNAIDGMAKVVSLTFDGLFSRDVQ